MATPTDGELERIERTALAANPSPYASRRALFEYGRRFEREHQEKVKAAAQRYAGVNAALNRKLSEWPEEDNRGDG